MVKALNTEQGNENSKRAATSPLFGRWAFGALIALCLLIVLGLIFLWQTGETATSLAVLQRNNMRASAGLQKTLVDESPWDTAKTLTALAVTQEELAYAREAERLSDHDVDQAFAAALREATLQQKELTGAALEEQQRVKDLESSVAADQQSVSQLTPKGGDDLDVAKAQLSLDQDELSDAREDLARASGDQRDEIQQELTAREADMKRFDASQATGEAAVISVHRYRTLAGLIGAWSKQNQRYSLLLQAKQASLQAKAKFGAEHDSLEKLAKSSSGSASDTATRVAGLNRLSLERQLISIYDDRVDTEQRLATIYDKWAAQVSVQHKAVLRLILIQLMWIFVIVIIAILLDAVIRRITEHELLDPRRLRTLSGIFRLAIQILALVAILLVIFGAPNQISTVIGLATAGLTVALQDFILGFVGWFILMGKGGNAVGDVVEIDGVAGEVVEIGLFRTTLLETGNWTAKGHPTGRRAAFNNKYAISGKFFNFTTAGQWMWDELTVTIPLDAGTHDAIERVQAAVAAATRDDAEQAEREWRQATNSRGLTQFSAQPAVNLRPSAGGVDLVVRYVTKAVERFEERNKVNRSVLDALRAAKEPASNEQ